MSCYVLLWSPRTILLLSFLPTMWWYSYVYMKRLNVIIKMSRSPTITLSYLNSLRITVWNEYSSIDSRRTFEQITVVIRTSWFPRNIWNAILVWSMFQQTWEESIKSFKVVRLHYFEWSTPGFMSPIKLFIDVFKC